VRTDRLIALALAGGLLAGLGLSGCGDTGTSDYDYRRAAPELPEIVVPVEAPSVTGPGMVGVYGG
jgi:hypothetical protein